MEEERVEMEHTMETVGGAKEETRKEQEECLRSKEEAGTRERVHTMETAGGAKEEARKEQEEGRLVYDVGALQEGWET